MKMRVGRARRPAATSSGGLNGSPMRSNDSDEALLKLEAAHCSWGDAAHYYTDQAKVFARAEGSYLYDTDGVGYLDLQMCYSAANFGYKHPRLQAALTRQLDTLPQLAGQYLHKEKVQLATKLAQRIEKTFGVKGRVHFSVGGSSAIEDSLKLVRSYTGKTSMFAFMGGYHGRTLGALSLTAGYHYRERFGHVSDRATLIPYPDRFRCPNQMTPHACGPDYLQQFERLFETAHHGVANPKTNTSEYGAFYIEPVQGRGGYIVPPREYFAGLKRILDRYRILLVDDEVQMGFFRTGKCWAIEHFGVVPDIIVFGKSLTNGLNPLSGIWAKEELISPDAFPPGSTHATFSANPLGTAVGLETMTLIEEDDASLSVEVPRKGQHFLSRLRQLQRAYPQIGDVDGLGLALRIELCQADGRTPNPELTKAMVQIGLSGKLTAGGTQRGLILNVGGYHNNVITLAPSLYIDECEIDLAMEFFEEALQLGIADTALSKNGHARSTISRVESSAHQSATTSISGMSSPCVTSRHSPRRLAQIHRRHTPRRHR